MRAHRPDRSRRALAATLLLIGPVVAACSASSGGSVKASTTTAPTTAAATTTTADPYGALKLNQLQVVGTHNSYHLAADPKEQALLAALSATQAAQRRYSHSPLPTQLTTEKVRQIELDVYVDTKGGLYAHPKLRERAGLGPYDEPAMARPGPKVMHEQDVDYHSVCVALQICLTQVKAWSDAHPRHVPLFIDIDFKDGPLIFNVPGQAKPEKWTTAQMDALDRQILSIFPRDDIVTPDDVRGSYPTLNAAVKAGHWPTLAASRGKVVFLMTNPEPYRSIYLVGHADLAGRLLFTNAQPGQPDAAYADLDDPIAKGAQIRSLVQQGYLVRTRSDTDDNQAHTGDTAQRDAALASGAQIVSTDYPGPDGALHETGNAYKVELPGFVPARCNPVTGPPSCAGADLEGR